MVFALQTLPISRTWARRPAVRNAAYTIKMGEILFGGREAIERAPVSISPDDVGSPLRYDHRMLAAMFDT